MQVLTSEYYKASRHYRMVPNLDRVGSIFSCLVFHGDIEYFSVAVETTTGVPFTRDNFEVKKNKKA